MVFLFDPFQKVIIHSLPIQSKIRSQKLRWLYKLSNQRGSIVPETLLKASCSSSETSFGEADSSAKIE